MSFSLLFNNFAFKFNQLDSMEHLNRIKVVLVEQGKTGKWLAKQICKSTCTVSKWCTNTAQPDLYTLNQIANILNVDKRDLLTASDNHQK